MCTVYTGGTHFSTAHLINFSSFMEIANTLTASLSFYAEMNSLQSSSFRMHSQSNHVDITIDLPLPVREIVVVINQTDVDG